MKHWRNWLLIVAQIVIALGSASKGLGQASGSTAPRSAGDSSQSETWRVRVLSVERRDVIFEHETAPRRASAGRVFLRVSLRLEYLGPEARLRPPLVELVDRRGTRYERIPLAVGDTVAERTQPYTFHKSLWFASGLEEGLAAGERMPDEIWFDFEVPDGTQDLLLAFGDARPFPLPVHVAPDVPNGAGARPPN